MSYFAKVVNGKVEKVLVVDAEFIPHLRESTPGTWVQTWKDANGASEKRYNFAGISDIYDTDADAFYTEQPFPSWTLNDTTYIWEAPVAYPDSGDYVWDEESGSWVEYTPSNP